MSGMKSKLASIAAAVAFVAATGYVVDLGVQDAAGQSQRVEEDSPQWDCHTMGNKICGPQQATRTSVEW